MSGKRRASLSISIGVVLALASGAGDAVAATNVSVSPGPTFSLLAVTGEANDDVISISLTDTTITVTDTGTGGIAEADPECTTVDANTVTCALNPAGPAPPAAAAAPVLLTSVTLNSGVDSFSDSGPFRDNLNWTSGDKTVSMGPGTDSTFITGIGNDVVDAGAGDDDIRQAQFSDGADLLDGGAGDDRLVYGSGSVSGGVSISIDGQPNDGRPGEGDNAIGFERLLGTSGNDTLIGDDSANDLSGAGGDDVLVGNGGSDGLTGDDGSDSLIGGAGRDDLSCGLGFDSVVADPFDFIAATCERRGAEVVGATAAVKGKGTAKVRIACPLEEGSPCAGNVVLFQGGRQIGAGVFEVANGQTGVANVKLSKPGRKLLLRNDGSLFVTAEAQTNEALGLNVNDTRVLLDG